MNASELFDLSGKVAVVTGGAGSIGTVYGRVVRRRRRWCSPTSTSP